MAKKMTTAERFFWEHGGYCFDPAKETRAQGRRRCAERAARDEAWLIQEIADGNATVEWEYDPEGWAWESDIPNYTPAEVLNCTVSVGPHSYSLCGIADPSPECRRVVEAELAGVLWADLADRAGNLAPQF